MTTTGMALPTALELGLFSRVRAENRRGSVKILIPVGNATHDIEMARRIGVSGGVDWAGRVL